MYSLSMPKQALPLGHKITPQISDMYAEMCDNLRDGDDSFRDDEYSKCHEYDELMVRQSSAISHGLWTCQ